MTAKEYLQQAYRLDQRIDSHQMEKEILEDMLDSPVSPQLGERVQVSRSGEAYYERILEKVWRLQHKINEEIDTYVDLKAQIREVISQIEDPDHQMVLRFRYVNGLSFRQIANEMAISKNTVSRWHDMGLQEVTVPEDPIKIR